MKNNRIKKITFKVKQAIPKKAINDFAKAMDEIRPYIPQKKISKQYSTEGKWEVCSIH